MHSSIKPPKQIHQYIIGSQLGQGAFASVFKAFNKENRRAYAIKVIPKQNLHNQEEADRFQREINASVFIRHENIVAVHDFFWDDNYYYLVQDLCGGGDLFHYIKKVNHIDESIAAFIFQQICNAVSYVHSYDVAHRDIKPENVLIDKFPRVKVADFGICGYVLENALMKSFVGSPSYSAPECLSKLEYDGKISDVWSLGVLLFVMVTGNSPWNQNTPQMVHQIQSADYYIPDEISEDCQDLIKKMMTVMPKDRIKLDEVLLHPFFGKASASHLKMPNKANIPKGTPSLPRLSGLSLQEISEIAKKDAQSKDTVHGIISPFESYKGDSEEDSEEQSSSSIQRKSLPAFAIRSQSIEQIMDIQQKGAKHLVFPNSNQQMLVNQRQRSSGTLLNRKIQLPPLQNPKTHF